MSDSIWYTFCLRLRRLFYPPRKWLRVLRRANDHEEAAFYLVERTVRRTRPRVGPLGLKAAHLPEGRIERNPIGFLRFRFDGSGSVYEYENPMPTRRLSGHERAMWDDLSRMIVVAKPVVDSEWNLLSMQLGARTLQRLPLGGIVTHDPRGRSPFRGSLDLSKLGRRNEPDREDLRARALLHMIDVFLLEEERVWEEPPKPAEWKPRTIADPYAGSRLSTTFGHGRRGALGKWHRCPMCHSPVVRGPYNPRIPYGTVRAGSGGIRDLRGGYMSRLRETYLLDDPTSLLGTREIKPRHLRAEAQPDPGEDSRPSEFT